MEHYVTLFDSLFLPQGLALHMSMERHVKDYTLWILCVDDETYGVLTKLQLLNVRLLQLSKLQTEELLRVKPTRSKGEYCWTLTPFAPRFVFETDSKVERVTYLDADLWFRKHPAPIFREFDASGKQVLITDHAYAPEHDQSATSGQYCVQFMIFARQGSEVVRKWWEDQCIDWCYARAEDGKFGDQKYLDDWMDRFPQQAHVLADKELILAPWNATRFPYSKAICWHFHSLRILGSGANGYRANLGKYSIPIPTKQYIYGKYISDIGLAIQILTKAGVNVRSQGTFSMSDAIKTLLHGYWVTLKNLSIWNQITITK